MKALITLLSLFVCISLFSIEVQASGETERDDFPNFIENKGQWHDNILYQVEMFSANVFLEADRLTYLLMDDNDLHDLHHRHHHPHETWNEEWLLDAHAFNVQFVGANPNASKRASCDLPNYRNYYIGNDPEKWASNVGIYRQIDYDGLYENIGFRLYGFEGNVKYDFMVAPHGDPSQIKLLYEGADDVFIKDGNLHIVTSVNTVIEQAPYAYQYIDGQEIAVDCKYKLQDRNVVFEFPEGYDPTQELIIDPVVVFATYSGSTADNWGFTATFDPEGNMYSAGVAFGAGYPTTMGAFQVGFAGGDASGYRAADIGITKYTPDGSNQIFSTYIGGSIANEMPHSLIVSESGELVLYGTTGSSDYPTTANAHDTTFGGGFSITVNSISFPSGADIIVSRFNSDGTALVGSTFVGGSQQDGLNTALNYNYADQGRGEVILDDEGNVFVASCTQSGDFPTPNGLFPNYNGGAQDACVFKLNQDLSVLEWGTFLGGTNSDAAYSLKLSNNNSLYVCGGTRSVDYPASFGSLQDNYSGGTHDGFITQLGSDGLSFMASTFLGTSGYDQSYFIELDEEQNVYTVGQTDGNYPVQSAGYVDENGGHYIHKLTSDLSTTIFSTRFGRGDGDPDISPTAFLVDTCGQIYVAGWGGNTNSASPANSTTNGLTVSDDAFQPLTDGSDFYLLVLAENATGLNYATFFGGNGNNEHVDGGTSRFDKNGVVYEAVCAACNASADAFPVTAGAWSTTNNSDNCNMGSFKFALAGPEVLFDIDPVTDCENPLNISFINNSVNASSYIWDFGDNTTSIEESPTHTYTEPGVYEVTLVAIGDDGCTITDTSAQITNVFDLPNIELVGEGTCLNDGTDNFSIDINFTGGSNTTYTLGGAASGTIGTGTTINLVLLGGEEYTITAVDNTTGCAGELLFTGPVCPDCEPSAGTMEPTDLQIVCADGTVAATASGTFLEEGQVLNYILHTSADTTAGTILGMNTTGTFTFPENGEYYTTYYISAVVSFEDATGTIDFEDACTVIANGSPVLFLAPVELLVDEFCDLQTGDFYVTAQVKGGFPEYNNDAVYSITGDFADDLAFMQTFTLIFPENGQNVYEINVVSDGFGCNTVEFTSEQFECVKNPIELLSFEGEATANGNLLEWVTLTESNNDRFVIERSEDGKNFIVIGEVKGVGNSQHAVNYTYLDRTVGCGVRYYRLMQYDNNGLSSGSPTISITRGESSGGAVIAVSPVPSRDFIEVTFQSAANTAELTLFDTKGQIALQQTINSESCSKNVRLDISQLVAGVYLLQINSGDKVMAQRLVKY